MSASSRVFVDEGDVDSGGGNASVKKLPKHHTDNNPFM